jgi:hypothetical protein
MSRYTDQHPQFLKWNATTQTLAPVSGGTVEFTDEGTVGASNYRDTYFQEPFTVGNVNANPLSLDANGRTVQPVYLVGTYNTVIKDSDGVQVDAVDGVQPVGPDAAGTGFTVVSLFADLDALDTSEYQECFVLGTTVVGDGGQGHFIYQSASVETANTDTIAEPDVGNGRWLKNNNQTHTFLYGEGAGTVDAFSCTFEPAITAESKTRFYIVESLGANTGAVTFNPGSGVLNLERDDAATDLIVGDTGPAGYQMIIKANEAETKYILCNPFMAGVDSITTASIKDDAVTYAKIQNMTTDKILGRGTAASGIVEELSVDNSTVEIATTTLQVKDDGITFAKMADMNTNKILGRGTAASGIVEELSVDDSTVEIDSGTTTLRVKDDGITYAKMQDVAANNVFLGNDDGASSTVQEIAFTSLVGLLGISGAASTESVDLVIPYDSSNSIRITGRKAQSTQDTTQDFTFPTAFSAIPVVLTCRTDASGGAQAGLFPLNTVSTTRFQVDQFDTIPNTEYFYYLAIGKA